MGLGGSLKSILTYLKKHNDMGQKDSNYLFWQIGTERASGDSNYLLWQIKIEWATRDSNYLLAKQHKTGHKRLQSSIGEGERNRPQKISIISWQSRTEQATRDSNHPLAKQHGTGHKRFQLSLGKAKP